MNLPTISHERMSDIFQKFHIENLPFNAVIHHFTKPDEGDPHDHPFSFTSHVLQGGYIERVWTKKIRSNGTARWIYLDYNRKPGSAHHVKATDIHQIISLPQGECYTLILPEKWERKSGFWRFEKGEAKFREWDQEDFKYV